MLKEIIIKLSFWKNLKVIMKRDSVNEDSKIESEIQYKMIRKGYIIFNTFIIANMISKAPLNHTDIKDLHGNGIK